jgi:hypothetical protein
MVAEEWRDIEGYPGYKVSSLGNVRGKQGFNLSLCVGSVGYYVVNLCRDSGQKQFKIHRLVAEAFIPNPDNLPFINHKDGVKTNNLPSNLEWVTPLGNVTHALRVGLTKSGAKHNNTMPVQATPVNGHVGHVFFGTVQLRIAGFNQGNVSNCCTGRNQTHYGYRWSYINGA